MGRPGTTRPAAPEVIASPEFALAAAAALAIVGLAVPLLVICARHLALAEPFVGCSFGAVGLAVTAVGTWKLSTALTRVRERVVGGA